LTKIGSGTLLLTGSNTYSGVTTISQGELEVNGSLASPVAVNSGGILGGTGSLASVTVNSGGHLAPGDSPGLLHVSGSLSLLSGAKMDYELDTPSASDEVLMPTGLLSLNGQQFSDFNFTPLGGFGVGQYTLIDAGSISGSLGVGTIGAINGLPASLAMHGNDLVLNVVPEPGTLVLLTAGAIALLCAVQTRRRQATERIVHVDMQRDKKRLLHRTSIIGWHCTLLVTLIVILAAIDALADAPTFLRSIGGPAAGSGNGQFNGPCGITVDPSGNVWVADQNNGRVEEFNNTGGFLRAFSISGNPWGVGADPSGNIWVADESNQRVRKFNNTGTLLATANSSFAYPLDLAVDSSGDVWVADSQNYRVDELNSSGSLIGLIGSQGTAGGQFSGPCGIGIDPSGDVWATDLAGAGGRIEEFSSGRTYLTQITSGVSYPRDLAVDSRGDIWVADAGNNSIEELNSSGTQLLQITSANNLRFGHIIGLALDSSGDLWATDIGNERVVEFAVVPEPSALVMLTVAALLLAAIAWRRSRLRLAAASVITMLPAGLAQADVFNMPAGQTSLQFVTVGDPGNTPDPLTGGTLGSVGYTYLMGKYDVTLAQYAQFLNAVAKTDAYGLYSAGMGTDYTTQGISRAGSSGSYTYSVTGSAAGKDNMPVFDDTWGDAARFCNWLQNGQGTAATAAQAFTLTETGAYLLNGGTSNTALMAITRNPAALYFIPSENEWYKAAYYKGGANAGYWAYPTQSNSAPDNSLALASTEANDANYRPVFDFTDPTNYLTPVGTFVLSPGPYGTFDQGGDLWQWDEAKISGSFRGWRGGSLASSDNYLSSSVSYYDTPTDQHGAVGFRIASSVAVPEPGALALLCVGGLCMLGCTWRKRLV
jgi:autotransporter-associated beta strand protein